MSYQVLARKWRPSSFREMAGQTHVLKALINALDHDRLHHAYLFTGTRGVGKTTIARILAKCLNCETGVSSEPCGRCDACVAIAEGRFVDLIEVDAASKTKVDDTREMLENVQYTPTRGRYKVYLIDEVHMLSGHSFNALLKTLEEPPPHVKFLLATTDPQKIPPTILSRCLQFSLKNMAPEKIVEHLQHILGKEMITFEEPALWQIARAAEGSMRDALSLTDQAIAFGGGKLLAADVESMLGSIDRSVVVELVRQLEAGDAAELLKRVQGLAEQGADFAAVLLDLLALLHRVALVQAVPEAVDTTLPDYRDVQSLAQSLPAEDVQYYYQLGLVGRRDMSLAPDARSGLEMVLLRMLAFKPAGVHQIPVAGGNTPPKKSVPSAAEPAAPAPANAAVDASHAHEPRPETVASATSPADGDLDLGDAGSGLKLASLTSEVWREQFDRFGFAGLLRSICSHCVLAKVDGQTLYFHIDPDNANLLNESHKERFEKALTAYFNCPIRIDLQITAVGQETPAEYAERQRREQLADLTALIHADPVVQQLLQEFEGRIDDSSIRPLPDG